MRIAKRRFVRVLVGLGALVLVVAVGLVLLVRSSAVTTRVTRELLPAVTEAIGRRVTIGQVEVSLLPLGATVKGLEIQGDTHGPFVEAKEVQVGVEAWPLVRSLGGDVRVTAVELREPVVRLVRGRDGRWAHDAMLERWRDRGSSSGGRGEAPQTQVRVREGTVRVFDEAKGSAPVVSLTKVDADARQGPGGPTIAWKAALEADERNTSGDLRLEDGALSGQVELTRLPLDRLAKGRSGVTELAGATLDAKAKIAGNVIEITQGVARISGGTIVLDGTTVDLRRGTPAWTLVAHARDLALDRGSAKGTLAGDAKLKGRGTTWPEVRRGLNGTGSFELGGATWQGLDVGRALAGIGLAGAPTPGGTRFEHLGGSFVVQAGRARLTTPIEATTPVGPIRLTGDVGLDETLALTGTVQLSPAQVAAMTGLTPRGPVEVPMRIGGTVSRPVITGVDATGLTRSLVEEGLRGLLPGG